MVVGAVYCHHDIVDFRNSINGLSVTVEHSMGFSVYDSPLFLFCNKQRYKLKMLCWDRGGFCLWYKRLEKARLKWPCKDNRNIVNLSEEQFYWLLRGVGISQLLPYE
ncbi:MAG: transposase [Cellvibrionaceae bacterium]|jgi:transposase